MRLYFVIGWGLFLKTIHTEEEQRDVSKYTLSYNVVLRDVAIASPYPERYMALLILNLNDETAK